MATALRASEVEAVFSAKDEMSDVMGGISQQAKDTGFSLTNAAETALGFAAGVIGLQSAADVFAMVKGAVFSVNDEIDVAAIRFGALGLSVAQANQHVKDLMDFALRTAFPTASIIAASEKLRLMGGAALDTQGNLQMLVDAASATGMGVDTLATQIGRMYSALQNGLPISRYLTSLQRSGVVTGDAVAQIKAMEKAGASSAEIWAVLTGNIDRFAGTGNKLAATWGALSAIVKQTVQDLSATAFRPFFDQAKAGMLGLADWLRSAKVAEWATNAAVVVKRVGDLFGGIGRQVLPVLQAFLDNVASAFMSLLNALEPLQKPFGDLIGALFGAATAGQSGLVTALKDIGDTMRQMKPAAEGLMVLLSSLANLVANVVSKSFIFFHDILKPLLGDSMPDLTSKAITIGDGFKVMAGWVDQVTGAYSRFEPWLSKVVTQFLKSKPVIDAFNIASATVKDIIDKLSGAIGNGVENWNAFHDPVRAVESAIHGAGVSFDDINGFMDGFNNIVKTVVDFMTALAPIALAVATNFGIFKAVAVIGPILDYVGGIVQLVRVMWGIAGAAGIARLGIAGIMLAFQANPVGIVITAIGILVGLFILAYQHIKPFHDWVDKLGGKLADVGKFIMPQLQAAWGKLMPAFQSAGDSIGKLWGPLSKLAGLIWTAVKPAFEILGVVLGAILSGALGGFIAFLGTAIPMVVNLIVDAIQIVIDIVNTVVDIISGVMNILVDIFTGNGQKLGDDWRNLINKILEDTVQLFGDLVIGVVHLVSGLVITVLATLWGFVKGIIDFFVWLYNQLVGHSLIPDLINGIVSWFMQLPGRVWAVITALGDGIHVLLHGFYTLLLHSTGDLIMGIVGWFQTLPGMILSALGNLGGLLYNAGKSLIQGFLDGIIAIWNKVKSTVSGMAQWIKDNKGPISKDRQLLYGSGLALMDGLHEGMKAGWKEIQNTVSSMTAEIPKIGAEFATGMSGTLAMGATMGRGDRAVPEVHVHMDGIYAGDGPSLDILANKITQRLQYAPGT